MIAKFNIKNRTYTIYKEQVVIQIGAFENIANAFKESKRLSKITGKPTIIVCDQNLYKVLISGFETNLATNNIAAKLLKIEICVFLLTYN